MIPFYFLLLVLLYLVWKFRVGISYWFYGVVTGLEALFYGFKKHSATAEGIEHVYYSNDNTAKPLLVLIHGFSADKSVWLRAAKHFHKDYWVVIPDLAGHGETGFVKDWDYSASHQALRMAALIRSLGAGKAHIAGNSMGGLVAATMALETPDSVASIILVDPVGVLSPQPSTMLTMMKAGKNPFFVDSEEEFYQFFDMTMAQPPFIPNLIKDGLARKYIARKPQLQKIFADYNREGTDLAEPLSGKTVPSLVIWGAKDDLIHVSSAPVWQRALKSELVVWDDLGHMPMLEAPGRTADAMLSFLAEKTEG